MSSSNEYELTTFAIGEELVEDFRFTMSDILAECEAEVGVAGAVWVCDEGIVTIADPARYHGAYVRLVQEWYVARVYGEDA